jgi:hypothetical protein
MVYLLPKCHKCVPLGWGSDGTTGLSKILRADGGPAE